MATSTLRIVQKDIVYVKRYENRQINLGSLKEAVPDDIVQRI